MLHQPINLDDDTAMVSLIRSTGETVSAWFAPQPKKESFCAFFKRQNFRCVRSRRLPDGRTRLSVITQAGKEHYHIGRNFVLAYLGLRNQFYASNN